MEELDIQYKDICKSYFKFLLAIYGMYMTFVVLMFNGRKILDWFAGKICKLKEKFGRKEESEDLSSC